MAPWMTVVLAVFLSVVGVTSITPMFPSFNRPHWLRGSFGDFFVGLVGLANFGFGISVVVWSFTEISWYIDIALVFGAFVVSSIVYLFLPAIIRFTLFGPLISGVWLTVLHNTVWFHKGH